MATPKTNYDDALDYENVLKQRLAYLKTQLPALKQRYDSWRLRVDAHIVGNCTIGNYLVRVHPANVTNPSEQAFISGCQVNVINSMTSDHVRQAIIEANNELSTFNNAKANYDAAVAEINTLETIDIPAAEYDTQQKYQEWQKWIYDQLTPAEQAELNQVASDAEYLEILNQGRKYAIYAVIALGVIIILWAFYKFVIKKGA